MLFISPEAIAVTLLVFEDKNTLIMLTTKLELEIVLDSKYEQMIYFVQSVMAAKVTYNLGPMT